MPALAPALPLSPGRPTELPDSLSAQEDASADCVFSEEGSQRPKVAQRVAEVAAVGLSEGGQTGTVPLGDRRAGV